HETCRHHHETCPHHNAVPADGRTRYSSAASRAAVPRRFSMAKQGQHKNDAHDQTKSKGCTASCVLIRPGSGGSLASTTASITAGMGKRLAQHRLALRGVFEAVAGRAAGLRIGREV